MATQTVCDKCGERIKPRELIRLEVRITTPGSNHVRDLCPACWTLTAEAMGYPRP